MKQLIFGLLISGLSTSAIAQDGWKPVYQWGDDYSAPTADTVYVKDGRELFASNDGGNTWENRGRLPIGKDTAYEWASYDYEYLDFCFFDGLNGVLSVSLRYHHDLWPSIIAETYRTTDGGRSWEVKEEGMFSAAAPLRQLSRLSDSLIVGFGNAPDEVLDFGFQSRVLLLHRTKNQDRLWTATSGLLYHDAAVASSSIAIASDSGILIGDINNTPIFRSVGFAESIEYLDSLTLVSIRPNRISRDNGRTWEPFDAEVGNVYGSGIGVGWATTDKELRKTIDAGQTWRSLPFVGRESNITTIDSSIAYSSCLKRTSSGGWQLNVESVESHPVGIYPNPASNNVSSSRELHWFDLLGRSYEVPSEMIGDGYRYDVRGLNAGVYIVRYDGGSQMVMVE